METGIEPGTGETTPNVFTLQLNTNYFTTPKCKNGGATCAGWQQFVFGNYGDAYSTSIAYIQYWLLNYGQTCPDGWTPSAGDCYRSTVGVNIPVQTVADLAQLSLIGTAGASGMDTLGLETPTGDFYAVGSDSALSLAQGWLSAEFNIFGNGNATEANFSSGSTIVVRTSVDSGTTSAPSCLEYSFTGETDNLSLAPTCCPYGGAYPAIEFMESNAANPSATCTTSGMQAFTTLASFNATGGGGPFAGLVQATNGDFYGTTYFGGAYDQGTIFKITPAGTLTTLYSFCSLSGCIDGSFPSAGLVQATNGYLYGTTQGGGANRDGTVFKITPGGTLTTLYSFCAQSNCANAYSPTAGLVQATNGDLYGTTYFGGAYDQGTIFKITPAGTLTTLYSFCSLSGCVDGSFPSAVLVQATNGYLYGTTQGGGANNDGTVFKITPGGALTTLYSFCSQSNCTDGSQPSAGLVQATNGDLYGTTGSGGVNGYGTVFKITLGGALTSLYSFCSLGGCTDGEYSNALIQATNGDLYGTTGYGGAYGNGTVFEITTAGTLTTLHSFCSQNNCTDGGAPLAGLLQATDGGLYGTTLSGGANDGGSAFALYVGLAPFVETRPTSGEVGATVEILGTNLTGATSVTFNGVAAKFTVVSSSLITATVPPGATTGKVQVETPGATLSSNVPFRMP